MEPYSRYKTLGELILRQMFKPTSTCPVSYPLVAEHHHCQASTMSNIQQKSKSCAFAATLAIFITSSRVCAFVSRPSLSLSIPPAGGRRVPRRQEPGPRLLHADGRSTPRITSSSFGGSRSDVDQSDIDRFEGWNPQPGTKPGTVTLVGAGPGDPDLLTVGALRELQTADLVIADRLVSKEILGLVEGELRVARKYPGCAEKAQREIFKWMRETISAGKHVVRLKIGDPFIFGRGGEEVLEMRELGIEPKVIPGISSVFAAPLLGCVPVTHRGVATQVTLGTGYGQDYARPDICDYHPQKTAIFLMAIGRLEELCEDLREHGYPTDCPVAIIENASTPRQRVIAGEVNSIVKVARELDVKAPATIVVGEVVTVLHGRQEGLIGDVSEGAPNAESDKAARKSKKTTADKAKVPVKAHDGVSSTPREHPAPVASRAS